MSSKDYAEMIKKATLELKAIGESRRIEQAERLREDGRLTADEIDLVLKHGWQISFTPKRKDDVAGEEFHTIAKTVAKHPKLSVSRAFHLTGLDPFSPNDWLYLADALASIVLRGPRKVSRNEGFQARLKADVRVVRAAYPTVTMTELIMALHAMDKKTYSMSEPTLKNYLRKAGIKGLARESSYTKPRKLVVTRPQGL
ncbi:hypothetical protein [Afipia clevelandensis]|uniref:Uncharacterized protein n=1 Tax=Afipia clevelandensis ATCC 49720 TaxID=883079 RepID=K8NZI0_9BRAD|nr:hypothetical protein [Afipia clevelandensis]EKS33884.1 hypothetical protein HMPREF9696_03004 [Afipia clevelandensis ATCC 49720]